MAAPSESRTDTQDFSSWSASGHALVIEYSRRILDEIRAETVDGLNSLRHGGIEVGGVLFGVQDGDRIQVLGRRAFPCEYANGPTFHLSDRDEHALGTLIADCEADPELSGLDPVGWYHSHTRTGVFLSDSDLAVYDRHFPKPWQIALVLRPSQLGPAEAGFFFREADGMVRTDASYSPFTLDPLVKPPQPATVEQASTRVEPGRELHRVPSRRLPGWFKPAWLIPAFGLAAIAIGILAVMLGLPPSRPHLNLRAADQNGHVRIEWNRSAKAVRSAETASVLIVDGNQEVETELSPELLQDGSLVYLRKSGDVEISLRVTAANSDSVQELTRLIGLPSPPAVAIKPLELNDRPSPPQRPSVKKTKRRRTARSPEPETVPSREPATPLPRPALSARIADPGVAPPPRIPTPSPSTPKAVPAYRGPTSGRLIWTGTLAARNTLRIEGDRVSSGDLTGSLPKAPIKVNVYPASFSREGMDVFARELPGSKALTEPPGPGNGWTRTVYKRNPKHADDVVLTESPSAHNNWKRIGLSAGDHTVSAIVIDWHVLPQPAPATP